MKCSHLGGPRPPYEVHAPPTGNPGSATVHEVPLIAFRYENLVLDMKGELIKILKFLKMTISKETLECVARNSEGKFHRKSHKINHFIGMDSDLLEKLQMIEDAVHKAVTYRINTPLIY